MITAIEAKNLSTQKADDFHSLMSKCSICIQLSAKQGMMFCLVPTAGYSIGAKIKVLRELINVYGYSVSQRNNDIHENSLYIKWGHAKNDPV